jgi:subfamily B ATP-binding cassette protein MsbA
MAISLKNSELYPFFKLLKPVRIQFGLAILCGLIYGLSSGFGLPFMTHKVFPLIFNSEGTKVQLYTQLESGDYYEVEGKREAYGDQFLKENSSGEMIGPISLKLTTEGLYEKGQKEQLNKVESSIFVDVDGQKERVIGGLYIYDGSTRSYLSLQKRQAENSQWTMIGAVLLLPIIFIFRGASSFFNIYLISFCGLHILEQIRLMVFDKLQQLSTSFFERHKSGDLLNRLLGDTAALQSSISVIANDIVKQPITLVGGVGYLIYQSWQQSESIFILLCFVVIGLCVFPIRYIGKHLLKKVFEMQAQQGDLSAICNENIHAFREVRSFNLQERETKRFTASSKKYFGLQLKVVRYSQGLNPMIEVVTATGLSAAIYYASQKGITLSDIIPLILALYMSYDPIKKMGNISNEYKKGMAALKRINYVLDQKDDTPEPSHVESFPESIEELEFFDVNFSYEEELVLQHINIKVPKGSTLALVGPSGAGKSTFASLIPRFYDVQSGSIAINGCDTRSFSKEDLRRHISIVSQDTFLFDDTVIGNLKMGRIDATKEEIILAAKQAQAHDFIEALPQGYETVIGERGTRLSGGQKQRLAIARAFIKNAPILILDEATSALDSESEAKIQTALESLVVGKTVFIIAHRFSTIKLADRILVFNRGVISGDGTHDDLIAHNETYRDLHARQELK